MRLIWNAGAACAVTGMLTIVASFGSAPGRPAHASTLPILVVTSASDTPHRHYSGLSEHFQAANTSHDGKLTPAQARQAEWTRVANHFDEIDTDHLGFITEAQIHAYNMSRRHGRKPAAGDV